MPTLLCCPSDDTRQCGHCLLPFWHPTLARPQSGAQTHLSTPLQPSGLESSTLHPLRWSCLVLGAWDFGIVLMGDADSIRAEGRGESLRFSRGPEFHQRLHL